MNCLNVHYSMVCKYSFCTHILHCALLLLGAERSTLSTLGHVQVLILALKQPMTLWCHLGFQNMCYVHKHIQQLVIRSAGGLAVYLILLQYYGDSILNYLDYIYPRSCCRNLVWSRPMDSCRDIFRLRNSISPAFTLISWPTSTTVSETLNELTLLASRSSHYSSRLCLTKSRWRAV